MEGEVAEGGDWSGPLSSASGSLVFLSTHRVTKSLNQWVIGSMEISTACSGSAPNTRPLKGHVTSTKGFK